MLHHQNTHLYLHDILVTRTNHHLWLDHSSFSLESRIYDIEKLKVFRLVC